MAERTCECQEKTVLTEEVKSNEQALCVIINENRQDSMSMLPVKVICLACGSANTTASLPSGVGEAPDLASCSFLIFCKLLGVKLRGKSVWWNFKNEAIPFCDDCKRELDFLVDLHTKLQQVQKEYYNGVTEFKEMIKRSEVKFIGLDIYDKDTRYHTIRRQICGATIQKATNFPEICTPLITTKTRGIDAIPIQVDCIKYEVDSDSEPNNSHNLSAEEESTQPQLANTTSSYLHVRNDTTQIISRVSLPLKKRQQKSNKSKLGRRRKGQEPDETTSNSKARSYEGLRLRRRIRRDRDSCNKKELANEEDDDDDDGISDKKDRTCLDRTTGNLTFLHVTFQKTNEGKYRCLECEKETVISRSSIRKHTITSHTSKFVCTQCGQHTGSSKDLISHIRRVHRGEGKVLIECPVCGKPCSSKQGRLEKHKATHYNEQDKQEAIARGEKVLQWSTYKKHQCDECGKRFEVKCQLIQHKISKHPSTDVDEKDKMASKEICPECGKFVHRGYLKKHREFYHSDTGKRFICSLCDMRFFKSSLLTRHKNVVHEGIRPFKCTFCPKEFAQQRQLLTHMNNHQNIRPFQCSHCPMAFVRKSNMERHVNIFHVEGANPKRKSYVRGPETKMKNQKADQSSLSTTHPIIRTSSSSATATGKTNPTIPETIVLATVGTAAAETSSLLPKPEETHVSITPDSSWIAIAQPSTSPAQLLESSNFSH